MKVQGETPSADQFNRGIRRTFEKIGLLGSRDQQGQPLPSSVMAPPGTDKAAPTDKHSGGDPKSSTTGGSDANYVKVEMEPPKSPAVDQTDLPPHLRDTTTNAPPPSSDPAHNLMVVPKCKRRWFIDPPLNVLRERNQAGLTESTEVQATPAESVTTKKAGEPAQAPSATPERPLAESASNKKAGEPAQPQSAHQGSPPAESVSATKPSEPAQPQSAKPGDPPAESGSTKETTAPLAQPSSLQQESLETEDWVVHPQDCPLMHPDDAALSVASIQKEALNDSIKPAPGSEPTDGRSSSAHSPMEWEMHTSWQARKAETQMKEWLAVLDLHGIVDARKSVIITNEEFQSGDMHVEAARLVPPPEHDETLPNPEKASNAGQSSNLSMLMWALAEVKRNLKQSEAERARAAGTKSRGTPPRSRRAENPHAPKASIYLRYATPSDLEGCLAIYNHYVHESVVVPQNKPLPADYFNFRLEDIQNAGLPWIVAVAARGKRYFSSKPARGDKIVGYALAEDHSDPNDAFRHTVELVIFTHPDYLRLGIGKTLMDRLMCLLDPSHTSRGGYRFMAPDDEAVEGRRVVSKVLCLIPYTSHDLADIDWKKRWLAGWDFVEVGNLRQTGVKFGKWLSMMYFQKTIPRDEAQLLAV